MLRTLLAASAVVALAVPAAADQWTVDPAQSEIAFSGEHAGKAFRGVFEDWSADIVFDPDDLSKTDVTVTVQTGSAETGDRSYNRTLPRGEWFDVDNFPTATFTTTDVVDAAGGYVANGELTIKDLSMPVQLLFTLEIDGDTAVMNGGVTVSRTALNLGLSSDAPGDWVSLDIPVEVSVTATRAGG